MKAITVGWFCRSLGAPSRAGGITQTCDGANPSVSHFCQRKDKPRSLSRGARSALPVAQNGRFWGVHNVHTLGFGLGPTGGGRGRIAEVFGGVAEIQGPGSGSSPTLGTA